MATRAAPLAILAALTAAAHAQPDQFTFTWQVDAFDIATGNIVATNVSQLDEGQGAEFIASWSFTPPVGTVRTNQLGQTGPVFGFRRVVGDFAAGAGHDGTFAPATAIPAHFPYLFEPGTVETDQLRGITLFQHPSPTIPVYFTQNAMGDAFRVRWMPLHWSERTVDFAFVKSAIVEHAAELYLSIPPQAGPNATFAIQNEHFHGGSVQLQIIPAPGSAFVMLSVLLCARRNRRARHSDKRAPALVRCA